MAEPKTANTGAEVVDLQRFRSIKRGDRNTKDAPYIHLQASADGRVDFSYDIDPRQSVAFMSACLVMCAKLLANVSPPI